MYWTKGDSSLDYHQSVGGMARVYMIQPLICCNLPALAPTCRWGLGREGRLHASCIPSRKSAMIQVQVQVQSPLRHPSRQLLPHSHHAARCCRSRCQGYRGNQGYRTLSSPPPRRHHHRITCCCGPLPANVDLECLLHLRCRCRRLGGYSQCAFATTTAPPLPLPTWEGRTRASCEISLRSAPPAPSRLPLSLPWSHRPLRHPSHARRLPPVPRLPLPSALGWC